MNTESTTLNHMSIDPILVSIVMSLHLWAFFCKHLIKDSLKSLALSLVLIADCFWFCYYRFKIKCLKVYFIWSTSNQRSFEWLIDILKQVEEVDINSTVSTNIFITQFFQSFDLRTSMLVGGTGYSGVHIIITCSRYCYDCSIAAIDLICE